MHKYLVGLKGQNGYLLFRPVEGARVELVGWESGRARKGREMLMNGRGETKALSHLCRPVEKRVFTQNLADLSKLARNMGVLIQEPCHIAHKNHYIVSYTAKYLKAKSGSKDKRRGRAQLQPSVSS